MLVPAKLGFLQPACRHGRLECMAVQVSEGARRPDEYASLELTAADENDMAVREDANHFVGTRDTWPKAGRSIVVVNCESQRPAAH